MWKPAWDDGTIIIRTARKEHRCHGGYDRAARRRLSCDEPILKGSQYVEYIGESAAFASGQHYHLTCAEQQGLVVAVGEGTQK